MTFTIVGPGLQDTLHVTKLLRPTGLRKIQKIETKNDINDPESDQNNPNHKRAATSATQAYKETNELIKKTDSITAAEIMSHPVITLTSSNTIENALEVMQNYEFHHLPIVTMEVKQLIGLISERNLLQYLTSGYRAEASAPSPLATTLETFMSKRVLTASADTRLHELAGLFIKQRIGAIPIIEENTQVIGMITQGDVLRTLVESNALELWV